MREFQKKINRIVEQFLKKSRKNLVEFLRNFQRAPGEKPKWRLCKFMKSTRRNFQMSSRNNHGEIFKQTLKDFREILVNSWRNSIFFFWRSLEGIFEDILEKVSKEFWTIFRRNPERNLEEYKKKPGWINEKKNPGRIPERMPTEFSKNLWSSSYKNWKGNP